MKQGKTLTMDELVNLYLEQMGLSRQFKEREVCQVWPDVVGGNDCFSDKEFTDFRGKSVCEFHFFRGKKRDLDGERGINKSSE